MLIYSLLTRGIVDLPSQIFGPVTLYFKDGSSCLAGTISQYLLVSLGGNPRTMPSHIQILIGLIKYGKIWLDILTKGALVEHFSSTVMNELNHLSNKRWVWLHHQLIALVDFQAHNKVFGTRI